MSQDPASRRRELARAYAQANPDILIGASSGFMGDPLLHYESAGRAEGRVFPTTDMIPIDWSDEDYVGRHPTLAGLLRSGVASTLYHFAETRSDREEEIRRGCLTTSERLLARLNVSSGVVQDLVIACMESGAPHLARRLSDSASYTRLPDRPVVGPVMAALRAVHEQSVDVVVVVHWLHTGGAELEAVWHYRAAEALGLSVAFLIADVHVVAPNFSRLGMRVISIPQEIEGLGIEIGSVSFEQRVELVRRTIAFLDPKIIHFVNSWIGFNYLASAAGADEAIAARSYVSMFCPHVFKDGRRQGYMRYMPDVYPKVAAIITDTRWFADELGTMYAIPETKLEALGYPVAPAAKTSQPRASATKVLWASRLDYQKNPSMLVAIAQEMPDIEFEIWGRVVLADESFDIDNLPANVTFRGEFFDTGELPISEYSAFVYTSLFDGLPNILLEIAAAGLPIVSSSVGGIREFFEGYVSLVDDPYDLPEYVRMLELLLSDRDALNAAGDRLRGYVLLERTFYKFLQDVGKLPLYRALNSPFDGDVPV